MGFPNNAWTILNYTIHYSKIPHEWIKMEKSYDLVNVCYIAFNKITHLGLRKQLKKNLNQLRTETLKDCI